MRQRTIKIAKFGLKPGEKIGGKYRVEEYLGGGLQGEVYRVTELQTRIPRAAKLFYPQENLRNSAARIYAQRLNRLRDCPIVIQYHHAEWLPIQETRVTCLISEFVGGILLPDFISSHPGKRIPPFKALHLLYSLVNGLEQIHRRKEYHGDIHSSNILVLPRGIFFDVKLVDFYNLGKSTAAHRRDDILGLVQLLYEMVGGQRHYARQPDEVKKICRGLRHGLIRESFPTAGHLRRHLETAPRLWAI